MPQCGILGYMNFMLYADRNFCVLKPDDGCSFNRPVQDSNVFRCMGRFAEIVNEGS